MVLVALIISLCHTNCMNTVHLTEHERNITDKVLTYYATGRAKRSVARLWIKPAAQHSITVNKMNIEQYFNDKAFSAQITHCLESHLDQDLKVQIKTTVAGGGHSGQYRAILLAMARAITEMDPELRSALKAEGLLTRDRRVVERKKYGLRKARKSPPFQRR